MILCDAYDRGFSFFSFHSANRPHPETLTTLNRTPGISPLALPFRPNPASSTSSFSSTKFKQPSLGTTNMSAHNLGLQWSIGRCCPPFRLWKTRFHPAYFQEYEKKLTKRSHLLAVLDKLHANTLSNRTVGLLGLNSNLLQHDALGM